MDYETFKWSLLEEVNRKTGADTTVRLHRLTGENGVRTDTISLIGGEGKASPALAVRPFYESYLKGESLNGLAGGVIESRLQGVGETPGSYGCVPELDDVRDRLYVRLINGARNRRLLESIPYVPFLDLAMVFYMRLDVSRRYDAMVLVRKGDLERWRITTEELEKMAVNNTVEQKVCELIPLEAFLEEKAEEHSSAMFVLTDTDRRYGAAALCYPGLIESIADQFDSDLYVLPSSVHEVIILPDEGGFSPHMMSALVREVNATEVAENEILSDHAYYYSRSERQLVIADAGLVS